MKRPAIKPFVRALASCLVVAALALPVTSPAMMNGGGGGGGDGDLNPAGEELFQGICFACHGTDAGGRFVRKSIRDASAQHIEMALNMEEAMSFLQYLSSEDINALADYLDDLTGDNSERLSGEGDPIRGEQLFRRSCTGCHSLGTSPRFGPDLLGVVDDGGMMGDGDGRHPVWVEAFMTEPNAMLDYGAYTEEELAQYPWRMSDIGISDYDALDITAFLAEQSEPLTPTPPVELTDPEFEATKNLYFNRCAGCHGLYRTGATGPDIGEARAEEIGTDGLGAMLRYGTPGGMPNFGQAGILTDEQITHLASYLQMPPPDPPPLPMDEIQASWQLFVPVADRPTSPQTTRDWQDYFGVVLRDAGKVAIFDGDTHEEVVRLDVGFAVHILRSSSSGRYFYAVGRDGVVTMIDLWMSTPSIVAQVKGCHDARSVDGSKFTGYEDKYLIEGCYWPPQYVVYDGLTLEPLARNDLPMESITGETLPEVRVAAIVASDYEPAWVVNQKESGYVGIVDYSQPGFPLASNIATERFLHDGGWDHTGRYFLTAANASNKMVVVDTATREFVTSFTTGEVPHPGRGANWVDPVYGWVNATPHIGSPVVSIYGADPANNPDNAWQVVREITLPASGSLFIKTHPASSWVLVDMTLSSTNDRQVCAIEKATGALDRCFDVATNGKAVHMEFNREGTEVWISDWASDGRVVILDAQTLEVIDTITGLPTPTGKFNVYNTAHDVY